jgi:hypothetical protein
MKRTCLILVLIGNSSLIFSQESMISVIGGYCFSNIENTDQRGNGWRINGLYEFNPMEGKIAHGFSVGLASLDAEEGEGTEKSEYSVSTMPICYTPKYLLGSGRLNGFLKVAIGLQRSWMKRTGIIIGDMEDKDWGFAGGAGAGGNFLLNDKIFLTAEYELLYCSNSYYRDGVVNTLSLGIGFKF